jgi:hypothetical protein
MLRENTLSQTSSSLRLKVLRLARRSAGFITLCAGGCVAFAESEFATDAMTDEELVQHRKEQVALLRKRSRETKPEKTPEGTKYQIFYCTVYYTPKESGFTAEQGFDVTPETAPGLNKRTYARSFLAAVKREGFGRLVEPVDGLHYLQYTGNGRYQFAEVPLGRRGNVLVPRKSCAISRKNAHLPQRGDITIESPLIETVMGSREWVIEDTGGGVHPLQIDLYWGEDEPRGGVGRNVARPAGTAMEYAFEVVVITK